MARLASLAPLISFRAPFGAMYAGLGVCAHDDKAEATAVFSDVTVEVLPPPAPPSDKR